MVSSLLQTKPQAFPEGKSMGLKPEGGFSSRKGLNYGKLELEGTLEIT